MKENRNDRVAQVSVTDPSQLTCEYMNILPTLRTLS